MDYFNYRQQQLYAEEVAVSEIAAAYGTPCYIYSRATIERHWHAFDRALANQPHLICYAVKANSNLAVLNILARLGSGFDVVSGGELTRVITAGGNPQAIVFSGVGKTCAELAQALQIGVHCINVESPMELQRLQQIAANMGVVAPVSLRVNPDVDAQTHPYIATGLKQNKFGIELTQAKQLYAQAQQYPNLNFIGIDCHIGSQLTQLAPFIDALQHLLKLVDELAQQQIAIEHLNLGGGLGVTYTDETPPLPHELVAAIYQHIAGRNLKIILEPGRAIMANAGILVTKVEYVKSNFDKNFAIVDAAMNDLLRPALYAAQHQVIAVQVRQNDDPQIYDIVGPVCETGDFLAKQQQLVLQPDDLLAIRTAGAYGFSMSSNYNTRPRVAEVLVDGTKMHLIRARETIEDLLRHERIGW